LLVVSEYLSSTDSQQPTTDMVVFPHCKINLGLHVISKREDGYHNIETCFYPVPWTDILEIIPAREFSFTSSGTVIPGKEEDNLCVRAYRLLQTEFGFAPVKIHLHKVLPTGAGLGGGSSDAAFTLRLLNSVFDLKLNKNQLRNYASQLGSDCAFFVEDKPMLGIGRGEQLEELPLSLNGYYLILVKPDIHVATADAYAGVKPHLLTPGLSEILKHPIAEWKEYLINDFEKSVFKKYPAIELIKEELYRQGALYASMSGSGSSVFGIFKSRIELSQQFAGMQYWTNYLN
jgi:4-diphosphocytidyl-2-C-methyl-D-erythritol kinase